MTDVTRLGILILILAAVGLAYRSQSNHTSTLSAEEQQGDGATMASSALDIDLDTDTDTTTAESSSVRERPLASQLLQVVGSSATTVEQSPEAVSNTGPNTTTGSRTVSSTTSTTTSTTSKAPPTTNVSPARAVSPTTQPPTTQPPTTPPTTTKPMRPEPIGCEQTGSARSRLALRPIRIRFVNRTSFDYNLFWVDYSGRWVLYAKLGANSSYDQPTFVSHPWIVADPGSNTCRVMVADPNNDLTVYVG